MSKRGPYPESVPFELLVSTAYVTCPYCGGTFPESYFDKWHVPCPNEGTDKA